MKTKFTHRRNARAMKTNWLPFGQILGMAPLNVVAVCHGNVAGVRRAGRSLTRNELERLNERLTQRGGGRDGAVQPGFLGNSYRIGIS